MSPVLPVGMDEAGRGPLVSNAFAAVVILPERYDLPGLIDSRKLSEKKRDTLTVSIREQVVSWSIASASPEEITEPNILHTAMLAIACAVRDLMVVPDKVLIDGNRAPKDLGAPTEAVVEGNSKIIEISAVSVLAKTTCDAETHVFAERYPRYGFDKHKGYGTAQHLTALQRYGVLPEHHRDFAPVRVLLEQGRLFDQT